MQKWASKGDGAFHAADRCLGKRGVLKVRNRQPLLEHSRGKVKHNPVFNVALLWGLRFTDRADDSITALIQNSGFCEWTMITQQSDRGTSGSSTKQHFFCWKQLPTTINPLRRLWLSKVSKRCVLAEVWALKFLLLYYKKTFKESVVIFPTQKRSFSQTWTPSVSVPPVANDCLGADRSGKWRVSSELERMSSERKETTSVPRRSLLKSARNFPPFNAELC